MPFTWALICLLIWLGFKRFKKSTKLLWISFGILFIFGNSFIQTEVTRVWESNRSSYLEETTYQTAIVLGGYASEDTKWQRTNFYEASGRLLYAIKLYQQDKVEKIILTGGSGSLLYTRNKEADAVKKFLVQIGIPEQDILCDLKARNTYENAVYTKTLLDSINASNNVLITSAFHAYRAKKCFNKQGLYPDILPTSYLTKGSRQYDLGSFLVPSVTAHKHWNTLIKEWFGILAYKLNGKI